MADNIQLNPGVGGDQLAARDVGGVKHQRTVIEFNDGGTIREVAAANPVPVVAGSLPLPSGAATEVTLSDIAAAVDRIPIDPSAVSSVQPVGLCTSVLFDNGAPSNPLTFKFANIDTATANDNAVVSAVTTKKIRVLSVALFASGAVDVYFNDGTVSLLGGTRKIKLDNSGTVGTRGFVLPFNQGGWFETAAVNRPLNLNLGGAVGVAGCLTYVEV